ncbi:MAG: MgtC/SapB family protein [Burkholderiales bacterium]|nr:MgtC/SapB family protein [Burkholderiales bacterium]
METQLLQGAQALGGALAVGILVGLERGWRDRELPEGGRVAGLRTFALIGLLGGALGLMAEASPWPLAAGIAGLAWLFAASWPRAAKASGTLSITTAVAALTTFSLAALAGRGQIALAVGAAVIMALVLDLKPVLHSWLRSIEAEELRAVLQLGLLSAVILPLLPDAGFGPFGALNPYKMWLAVVLIAALSLAGHAAMRLRGAQQGLLWTGLLGGLASSTAATLALSRTARAQQSLAVPAAAAIVAACSVMFLRMAVVVSVLQPALAVTLGGSLVLLGGAGFAATWWQWRQRHDGKASAGPAGDGDDGLFDLRTAIGFGLALGVVAVAVRAAKEWIGTGGIYGVALLSGLVDVDAIVISTVQLQSQGGLEAVTAGTAIMLAAASNMVAKAAMAWVIGGRAVGARVSAAFAAIALVGAAGGWLANL